MRNGKFILILDKNKKTGQIKRKVSDKLPNDFCEKVCDLELKLAKEFNIATLQELTKLFKVIY